MSMTREYLQRRDITVLEEVSTDLLDCGIAAETKFDIAQHTGRSMVYRLVAHVWAKQPKAIQVRKVPATYRELLKEVFFPRWLKKCFPVQYKTVEIPIEVLYPACALRPHPSLGDPVVYTTYTPERGMVAPTPDDMVQVSLSGESSDGLRPLWVTAKAHKRMREAAERAGYKHLDDTDILHWLLSSHSLLGGR